MILAVINFVLVRFLNIVVALPIDATEDNKNEKEQAMTSQKTTYRSSELTAINSSSEESTTIAGTRSLLRLLRRTMEERWESSWWSWWRNNLKLDRLYTILCPSNSRPKKQISHHKFIFLNAANKKNSQVKIFIRIHCIMYQGSYAPRTKGHGAQIYRNHLYLQGS